MVHHGHHHGGHHHAHHHVDHHYAHDAHHALDHHQINELQCTVDRLAKERSVLLAHNTRTEVDIAALKRIEDELRNTVVELLSEIKRKEEDANATTEELKSSLHSITSLLRTREEELSREVISSSRLNAANATLEDANRQQINANSKLSFDISSAKQTLSLAEADHCRKVDELNHRIACLIEENKCHSYSSHHGHHGHHGHC